MKTGGQWRGLGAVVAAVGIVLATLAPVAQAGPAAAAPAAAANAALTLDKTVSADHTGPLRPGDEFTYSIVVGCDDGDCPDTVMTDRLPSQFVGFPIVSTRLTPASSANTAAYSGCSTEVTADCSLTVTSRERLSASATGLASGSTYTVAVQLRVPSTLPATWPFNGTAVTNTANVVSSDATPASDSADVTVTVPVVVDTAVTKAWAPASQQYEPGALSTITLTTRNTSNVPAASLALQDPSTAAAGAAALDAANPFTLVDFRGFGPVTLPEGATTQQIDAYVLVDGTYRWVPGTPRGPTDAQLPDGVTAAQVAGIRITFQGPAGGGTGGGTSRAVLPAGGTAGSVALEVAQRESNRQTDAALVRGASDTNRVTGTTTVPGRPAVAKQATAPYAITPLSTAVNAAKTISPARIPAGTTATGTVTGTNTSNGTLTSLRVADEGYFTADLAFGGFSAPLTYPQGATAATVTWTFSDGSTRLVDVADGTTPATPTPATGAHLTGFALDYSGTMTAGAAAKAVFAISPSPAFVPADLGSVVSTNTVDVTGTNAAGTATAQAKAPLTVFTPQISLGLTKSLSPKTPVAPGGTVVAQLPTTASSDSAFVRPDTIVVTDGARPGTSGDFWDAFNPTSIAPTQVPAGSTLLIDYTTDGSTYQQLTAPVDATGGAIVFRYAIPTDLQGSIVGLRYTFTDPSGFPSGASVSPNTVFQARANLRSTGAATSVVDKPASVYTNEAKASGSGAVTGAPRLTSAPVTAHDTASIRTQSGTGTVIASKRWMDAAFRTDETALSAQSGAQAGTRLGWGVTATGYASLTVTDPAAAGQDTGAQDPGAQDPGVQAPGDTVFQAFDLVSIRAVSFAADPLLRWDTVSRVELYENGAWTTIAAPSGTWMGSTGFKGYSLKAAESAAATGVRFTVVPNDDARATTADPTAPPVGSGITSNTTARRFDLTWRLRDRVRASAPGDSPWVTGTRAYDSDGAGVVSNDQTVAATPFAGDPVSKSAADTISIIDNPPSVQVQKTTERSAIVVPQSGDVDPAAYPTNDFTITASNASASRASYLRVSDPMPCTTETLDDCASVAYKYGADPYREVTAYSPSNPFERFTLTKIAFAVPAGQVDPAASTVSLQRWSGTGSPTSTTISMTAARALTAADLADVVGVSVLYRGTDPATSGGTLVQNAALTMTLSTQLRATLRSTGAPTTGAVSVDNATSAQSYDPVLFPSGVGSTPIRSAQATVALEQGAVGVSASKTFSPTSLLEAHRSDPVTVTLAATQGDSTIATNRVTLTDADADFWTSFRLASFEASDVTLPAGADRVRVDVQTNGASTWLAGSPGPTATLPAGVALADVTGIRLTFDRADGALLSNTAPPAPYRAAVALHVRVLDDLRGTTTPVPFPSTVTNDLAASSHRADSDLYPDADALTTARFTLDPGTFGLDVVKTPLDGVHTVAVGDAVPWTIAFTNTGSGYLTVTDLVDTLPAALQWDGVAPTFTTSKAGLLSTDVSTHFDQNARTLTFDWPSSAAARRMAPGETFTVRLGIALQPGLTSGQRATNAFIVHTDQTLASCTNTSGNGQGVLAGLAATECGTSNYVQPVPGPALFTTKGVKGDVVSPTVAGGENPTDAATDCVTDGEGYYKAPCVANSVIGGTDDWKLQAVNSGTVAYRTLTFVDPLPFAGDRQLATGSARGSTYRPTFVGDPGMTFDAPGGTRVTWQVTTVANVCVGTGSASAWVSNPTCQATADTWIDSDAFTGDWAAVTGLRAVFDFGGVAGGVLAPGGTVTAHFRTVNTPVSGAGAGASPPASVADPSLAPTAVPVAPQFAWNQFGATAVLTTGSVISRAPIKAGVTLQSGALAVTKVVTGSSAATDAPSSFEADVACTVAGAPIDLGASARLTLDAADGYRAVVAGIPLGAVCTVAEAGAVSSYGEAVRTASQSSVTIAVAGSGSSVPASQQVTLTNVYEPGQLTLAVTPRDADVPAGQPVTYDIALTNTGIATAHDVVVKDLVPEGATVVDTGGGTYDPSGTGPADYHGPTVSWPVGTLAGGAAATFTVVLTYPAPGAGSNSAWASTPGGSPRFERTVAVDPCPSAADPAVSCSPVVRITPAVAPPPATTPPVAPPVPPASTAPASGASGLLAFTGSAPGGLALFGLAVLVAGVVLLVARGARRRRAAPSSGRRAR